MTSAERMLLDKARSGLAITLEDRLSVILTVIDVDWFRAGLRDLGLETREATEACARRKAEILREAL